MPAPAATGGQSLCAAIALKSNNTSLKSPSCSSDKLCTCCCNSGESKPNRRVSSRIIIATAGSKFLLNIVLGKARCLNGVYGRSDSHVTKVIAHKFWTMTIYRSKLGILSIRLLFQAFTSISYDSIKSFGTG